MVVHKRKKVVKYRGHTTHGGGHRKKRRGAGSRGGRGKAGTGKRAGHKVAGIKQKRLGRSGFVPRRSKVSSKIVSVGYFTEERVKQLVSQGKATENKGVVSVDLTALGFSKLLGNGQTSQKLKLRVASCSERAAEKIKAAGGEVVSSAPQSQNVEEMSESVVSDKN